MKKNEVMEFVLGMSCNEREKFVEQILEMMQGKTLAHRLKSDYNIARKTATTGR